MRQGKWSLTGLQTDDVTFAGNGTFTCDPRSESAFRPGMVEFHLDYEAAYDGITMQKALHRLTAGSIHYAVKAAHSAATRGNTTNATFDMDVDLGFGADGTATLVLDGVIGTP